MYLFVEHAAGGISLASREAQGRLGFVNRIVGHFESRCHLALRLVCLVTLISGVDP